MKNIAYKNERDFRDKVSLIYVLFTYIQYVLKDDGFELAKIYTDIACKAFEKDVFEIIKKNKI
ncbi:MAG: hypothetical protein R3Y43_00450 [Alphaproteobacteria bacterium]